MKNYRLKTLATIAVIAIATPRLLAADEGGGRIQELRARAAEAKQQGRMEDAQKLHREAEELAQATRDTGRKDGGDRREPSPQVREAAQRAEHLQQKAREAKEAGRMDEAQKLHEEAGQLTKRAREANRKDGPPDQEGAKRKDGPPDREGAKREGGDNPTTQKMLHVENAIRSLRAAGMNEPADALQKQLQAAHAEQRPNAGGDKERQLHEMGRAIGEMQRALQDMQRRVEELSRK